MTRLLDDFERSAPPADLYRLVAYPLPTMVIGDLLGVPARDRAQLLASMNALADGADAERSMRGATELFSYFLTSATRCESGENMLSDLRAQDGVDDLYVAKLASYLLFAGQWATAMEIAAGVSTLLANPRLWQALVDDPAVAPRVVEETLRAPEGITNVLTLPRYARADMAVDGTDIATGDLVLFDLGAANRDPAVFPADHVDLTRASIPPHLRFGAGKYYCVGAPIARVVLQSLYIQLATRFPRLRLVEAVDHATLARGDAVTLSVAW
ncbi:cytochrome P450 [Nocardia sp. NPDC050406]|uniref:cytochrome P450 n=1 Tax=Nocardia sp. NPDC050406 TaxID=3364318 RepID=UPI0037B35513